MIRSMRLVSIPLLALLVASCQFGSTDTHPVPSVSQIGANLKCSSGDHAYSDNEAGWGFCYPDTWRYILRSQANANPPYLDLTFNITDEPPCVSSSAAPGEPSPTPICPPKYGLFAYMIVSTYERGAQPSLATWVQANMAAGVTFQPIVWGNAVEAGLLTDGRRIALTPHHVVILDIRSGAGNLDLEGLMSARLSTWMFTY